MEIWDLYDEKGNRTGQTMERGENVPRGLYHLGADAWIMNSRGELLVQRRALTKESYPGMWAMTGGSALKGENSQKAIIREVKEEIGLILKKEELELVRKFRTTKTYIYTYFIKKDIENINELKLQKDEVMDLKWASLSEIEKMVEEGNFIKSRWDEVKDIMYEKLNNLK